MARAKMTNDCESEIALCVKNDNASDYGSTYRQRCEWARLSARDQSRLWLQNARDCAHALERMESGPFTATEILLAAAELAAYYAEHVKEMDL